MSENTETVAAPKKAKWEEAGNGKTQPKKKVVKKPAAAKPAQSKAVAKKPAAAKNRAGGWTPERKAAHAKLIKAALAAKGLSGKGKKRGGPRKARAVAANPVLSAPYGQAQSEDQHTTLRLKSPVQLNFPFLTVQVD